MELETWLKSNNLIEFSKILKDWRIDSLDTLLSYPIENLQKSLNHLTYTKQISKEKNHLFVQKLKTQQNWKR